MNFSQRLYRLAVSLKRKGEGHFAQRQLLRLRRGRLLISDPVVSMPVDASGKMLSMRLSHGLPLVRSSSPFYDSIFERLAQLLLDSDGHLTMIDVGANIGDTVNLVNRTERCAFLCVEADSRHFPFLEMNTQHLEKVTRVRALVSERAEPRRYALHEHHGTSYVIESDEADVSVTTIDELVLQYPDFRNSNLLKVDTDGFDAKVLRGAASLMKESKPVVLFELAPRHYAKAGKEEPKAVFELLNAKAYSYIGLYNAYGLLMMHCDISSPDTLLCVRQLVDHAHYVGSYYDVVAFHNTQEDRYKTFMLSERQLFTPPKPEEYQLT